ncbi:glycosyl hydrolases family 15-domain-containing protein [Choanephora cucurbitarum]|nr:glycosyl hydrolases family 15-domain-containing protein [Choanephora cucurbitarum]
MATFKKKGVLDRLNYYYEVINKTILQKQNAASGLMPASTAITSHGNYTDAWVRDNVYSIYAVYGLALAYRRLDDNTGRAFELEYSVIKLMRGLLFSMMRQSHKVEMFKQTQALEHSLHAKYDTQTGGTVVGDFEWGHLQIDATSFFLLALADMTSSGFNIIYSQDEVDFVQNLVFYIERAYRTPDYGIWERGNKINHGQPELNSSSIGMAVSALRAINGVNLFGARGGPSSTIHVLPDELTRNATTLHSFLPRESNSKEIDASVLSVIGFPAFALEDPKLIQRTREEVVKKLEGKYGMKRFLRDGHQTVVEDTSRLHYNPNELKVFENIESEWPLFFTYMVLEGLFTEDFEQAEEYKRKLEPLIINSGNQDQLSDIVPVSPKPTLSTSSLTTTKDQRRPSIPINSFVEQLQESEDNDSVNVPLLPELYYVPAERVEAERKNPHSQKRVPNENVPLVWANSLYFLGGLISEGLLSPSEVDPLGRRFSSSKIYKESLIQVVLLSEDQELQSALSAYGIETQTLEQISSTTNILPPHALVDVYSGLGLNSKLEMSGRPKRPIGVLGTSRLYKIQGQIYAFTPHFMDNNEFYINADPDYLVSEFENELSFTKNNWFYPGRPTMTVLLSHALLGTKNQKNILSNTDPSKKNLLNFFTSLRSGVACQGNVRVKLCRLAETLNTSNIQSLDFLINKPEVNWKRILRVANTSRSSLNRKKLGFSNQKTQASTPGHRTPGGQGSMSGGRTPKRRSTAFYGKSLASPLDSLHDDTYFDELTTALNKLKANTEPEFKLRAHEETKAPQISDSPTSLAFAPSDAMNKTGAVPKEQKDQAESPSEMLSLTLGDSSQFDQAVESLAASVNLYDQIDLLQYLASCRPTSYYIAALDASISDLLEEVYLKSMRSRYWSIARQAAGLLHKNVPSLTINVTDLVIRQKQLSIGSGPQEYLISMPVAPDTLNKMINEHCTDDVREGPVVQEIITYLGHFIRTQPELFEGILRLRTHYIIIALREEISRINNSDEEESVEYLFQLSPNELKSLLLTVLSGPSLSLNSDLVVRDRSGGLLVVSNASLKQTEDHRKDSYIPLVSSAANSTISIKAQSGGYFAGNFAKVEINQSLMEANSRGIHVWAIDRNESIILESASFDTHISEEESKGLAEFLKWLNEGMVVVIASKDEFVENLTEEAISALEALGSTKIRDVQYRDSYVFIGEKGSTQSILEAHQSSRDGPTELIERVVQLEKKLDRSHDIMTANNIRSFFPNSNGRWLRRRKNDGALNRVPSPQFFSQVWTILDSSKGLIIKNHSLPRDPIVLEKTPEEFNFALAVESFLGWFADPVERQVAIEVLSILYKQQKSALEWLDLPAIVNRSAEKFWDKWIVINKSCIERGGELFQNGSSFEVHSSLARQLFFDLPSEGTESTSTYILASLSEIAP